MLNVGHAACSSQSLGLSLGLATFYLCWILLCSHFNGIFPYPFLNKLPWPKAGLHADSPQNASLLVVLLSAEPCIVHQCCCH